MSRISCFITSVAALSTAAALAAGPSPGTTQENTVPYRSGGIGVTSQQAMERARSDYSLSLVFARADGAFLTDVDLEILDGRGQTVLDRQEPQPMVLVDLPAGRYTVVADVQGRTQRQEVQVPSAGNRHLVLSW
ncbi:MAG TPA: carboxypeptidase regulatory-like domain-containing protein [Hydrogenophaga sp.]|nr:carboxypeptidase regulatory-like domain-containing protein [Hydrogenophaga sp.]